MKIKGFLLLILIFSFYTGLLFSTGHNTIFASEIKTTNSDTVNTHRYDFGISPFFKSGYNPFISPSFSYRVRIKEDLDWNLGLQISRNEFDDTPTSEAFDTFILTCGISKYPHPKWYYGADFHYYYINPNDELVNYVKTVGKNLEDDWIPAFSIKTGYHLTDVNLFKRWNFPLVLEISYTFSEDYKFLRAIPGTDDHYEIKGFNWGLKTSFRF